MKKLILFFLIIGLVFILGTCNTPADPGTNTGTESGGEVSMTDGGVYTEFTGDDYPGAEVDLKQFLKEGEAFADISQYASVIVDATLYSAYTDEITNTIATLPAGDNKNLAQFTLLTGTGDWPKKWPNEKGNACGPTKYNMAVEGKTTWNVSSDATGIPAVLLIQKNEEDFPGEIAAIKINEIIFVPKSATNENDVVLDWGTGYTTELFPTDTAWPGKSVSLSDSETDITGVLRDISLYDEVIVEAVALDRNSDEFPAGTAIGSANNGVEAFFTIITNNSNWSSEIVKQYNLNLSGETSAVRGEAELFEDSGMPSHIVFMAKYDSSLRDDQMVGHVTIKKVTFKAKTE